jgi:hypothetical protein
MKAKQKKLVIQWLVIGLICGGALWIFRPPSNPMPAPTNYGLSKNEARLFGHSEEGWMEPSFRGNEPIRMLTPKNEPQRWGTPKADIDAFSGREVYDVWRAENLSYTVTCNGRRIDTIKIAPREYNWGDSIVFTPYGDPNRGPRHEVSRIVVPPEKSKKLPSARKRQTDVPICVDMTVPDIESHWGQTFKIEIKMDIVYPRLIDEGHFVDTRYRYETKFEIRTPTRKTLRAYQDWQAAISGWRSK